MIISLRYSIYHSFLRVGILTFAILLVFDSGLVSEQSKALSISTQEYLANTVSAQAGTLPIETNQPMVGAIESEGELAAKEHMITLNISENTSVTMDKSTLIISLIVSFLLLLILLNYVLDFIRTRKMIRLQTSAN